MTNTVIPDTLCVKMVAVVVGGWLHESTYST